MNTSRPQDPGHDAAGWTFQTLEHGGALPDSMPQVILARDAHGREAVYVPAPQVLGDTGLAFIQAATPMIDWLRGYGNPHAKAIIEGTRAELLVTEESFPIPVEGMLNVRPID